MNIRSAQLNNSASPTWKRGFVRTIHFSMIAMTGIFAGFVAAMAWVVKP